MYKYRDKYAFAKRDILKADKQSIYNSRLNCYSTIQQKSEGQKDYYNQNIEKKIETQITESSRIADQGQPPTNDYQSFQASILKKVGCIEEESNKLLEKKERQLYFLKIQLKSCQQRLMEAEQQLIRKDKKVSFLQYELQNFKNHTIKYDYSSKAYQIQEIERENEKLKQSLRILIQEKNLHWKSFNNANNLQNFSYNKLNMTKMKQQIEELRHMVIEMEQSIKNCPKCYTLNREKEEIVTAYNCLLKQHSQFTSIKTSKEKQLLENITNKIKENQNILRENMRLKQETQGRPYFKSKGERMKDSVAKRCRTLTDQF